jgi:hypothetical protein
VRHQRRDDAAYDVLKGWRRIAGRWCYRSVGGTRAAPAARRRDIPVTLAGDGDILLVLPAALTVADVSVIHRQRDRTRAPAATTGWQHCCLGPPEAAARYDRGTRGLRFRASVCGVVHYMGARLNCAEHPGTSASASGTVVRVTAMDDPARAQRGLNDGIMYR